MIYYITYAFTTVEKRTSWDTSLGVKASSPEEALQNWAKHKTKFVLQNLNYLEVAKLGHISSSTKAVTSCNVSKEFIEEFKNKYKEVA